MAIKPWAINKSGGLRNMEYIKAILALRGYRRGQTMTEYALILAAVAVVVFAGYQLLGTDINGLLSSVDTKL
jgi:Flp pilus assembly pilin Flp